MTEKSRSGAPLVEVVARVLWPHREKLLPRRTQLDFAPMPGDPIWIIAAEVIHALNGSGARGNAGEARRKAR